MSKVRVAHVITRLVRGGAQENTFQTVRLHSRERYEVDLIAGPPLGEEGSLEESIAAGDIKIVREPNLVRDISPFRDLRATNNLTRLFRQRQYHIVHTHTSKAGYIGRLAAKRAGTPVIVHTPHGNIFHGYFGHWPTQLFVQLERRAARWTDRLIELTRIGVEECLDHGIGIPEQYEVIHSGIDFSPYPAAILRRPQTRAELGAGLDELLIGGVGRLEPVKGFAYFIEAAERVAPSNPHLRFVLAGRGSEEAALRARAAPLGDTFRFLGQREDVPALMAALDLLVVPSVNEGMGRVIIEAAAAETPVLASNVGGIPEVVQDAKTGVLVPPKQPLALAQVIAAFARDPLRLVRMGAAARAFAVPRFALEEMVHRIEALYERLLKEKNVDA